MGHVKLPYIRHVFFVLGCLFFCVGAVGVVLPLLPTTPFMILALWSFARSSRRFHDWLYGHPVFGPPLKLWQQYRVIPPIAKWMALVFMGGGLIYLYLFSQTPVWLKVSATLFMSFGAWYILSKPSRPPANIEY